ncbi:hypothetical protein DFH06DRAFT_458941 [Mycena polygramma]|nr:hypothetical protein DFH06DRAFT_458941 [Mycena polygramma]
MHPIGNVGATSPFTREFLEGSQRLSPPELAIANEVISAAESRITDLDAAIAQRTKQIKDCVEQRNDCVEQIVLHKKATRAFRRIPPEIVSQFLASALPEFDRRIPWRLGHICSYWRAVALETPLLWGAMTDIFITKVTSYPPEKLKTQLARSANLPLTITFWIPSYQAAHPPIPDLLKTLVSCSSRWISASLELTPESFVWVAPLRGCIPNLRYLHIGVIPNHNARSISKELSNPFEIAPALRDVTLDDLSGLPHPLVLPFDQLIRLENSATYASQVKMLLKTPNLEAASLKLTDASDNPGLPIVHLPYLRRLYVDVDSKLPHQSYLRILDQLDLPVLKELYVVDADLTPIISLISRCPTIKLKTLRLRRCIDSSPQHISHIIDVCATVQNLALQIVGNNGDAILDSLTVGATIPARKLKVITLEIAGNAQISDGQIVNMIESRWELRPCRLRSVVLLVAQGECVLDEEEPGQDQYCEDEAEGEGEGDDDTDDEGDEGAEEGEQEHGDDEDEDEDEGLDPKVRLKRLKEEGLRFRILKGEEAVKKLMRWHI